MFEINLGIDAFGWIILFYAHIHRIPIINKIRHVALKAN